MAADAGLRSAPVLPGRRVVRRRVEERGEVRDRGREPCVLRATAARGRVDDDGAMYGVTSAEGWRLTRPSMTQRASKIGHAV